MSSAKFASITAGLLARKSQSHPSVEGGALDAASKPLAWPNEPHPTAVAAPPPSPLPIKDKSCSVRMRPHDYERLGILAIKIGATRQRLLKDSLVQYLNAKAQDHSCACLGASERNCGETPLIGY